MLRASVAEGSEGGPAGESVSDVSMNAVLRVCPSGTALEFFSNLQNALSCTTYAVFGSPRMSVQSL